MTTLRKPETTTPWKIGILDGPNLSNIGNEAGIRHHTLGSWDELHQLVARTGQALGVQTEHFVNNYEGQILEWIRRRGPELDGLLVNPRGPGQLRRRSAPRPGGERQALREGPPIRHRPAVRAILSAHTAGIPLISSAIGLVSGFGQHSYTAALVALTSHLDDFAVPSSEVTTEEQIDARSVGGGHI